MKYFPTHPVAGAVAAAALLFSVPLLAGNGTSLFSQAPSPSAMAAGGDLAGMLDFCRSLVPSEGEYWENFLNQYAAPYGVKLNDFSEVLVLSDQWGNTPVVLLRFVSESKPEELKKLNQARLTSVGGKPELFTLNDVGRDLQDVALGILSPGVCCAVQRDRRGNFPRLTFNGASLALTELVPQGEFLAFCCGAPRMRKTPFDAIDEFWGTFTRGNGGGELHAVIRTSDQMKASFLQMSFLALASMWLQNEVGMTPEEASAFLRKQLVIRQRGGQLDVRCRDVKSTLLEIAKSRKRMMEEDTEDMEEDFQTPVSERQPSAEEHR